MTQVEVCSEMQLYLSSKMPRPHVGGVQVVDMSSKYYGRSGWVEERDARLIAQGDWQYRVTFNSSDTVTMLHAQLRRDDNIQKARLVKV